MGLQDIIKDNNTMTIGVNEINTIASLTKWDNAQVQLRIVRKNERED